MTEAEEVIALSLTERCDFRLNHCGQTMRWTGGNYTWQGRHPDGASNVRGSYRCGECGAELTLTLAEPDQQDS